MSSPQSSPRTQRLERDDSLVSPAASWRSWRLGGLILLTVLLAIAKPYGASAADKPNFVVILCDDLGYGDLACYGHPHIKTPHLDRLAKQGIRFTDCYAASAVCSSSRAGILTGRNPNRSGIFDWIPSGHVTHLKTDETTIAELLRDAGYDTAQVGKWHLNGRFNEAGTPQPGDHGFDHWFATQNNAAPRHENPRNFVRNGEPVGQLEGFSCQLVAEEGVRWLKSRKDRDKPFFMHVCFHEPHEPVESPDDMVKRYLDAGVAKEEDQAQYFANVENLDAAVGKLMAALDEMDLAEDTLVFFTSDNGPETLDRYRSANRSWGVPGPLRGMKLHIYDGGIRVPGIVRWTGRIKPGQTVDTPIGAVDLLPTFAALAGVEFEATKPIDGIDITGVLDGKATTRDTPLFWWYYRALTPPKVALRDGDWKIVAHLDIPDIREKANSVGRNVNTASQKLIKAGRLTRFELYNLREDIGEKRDLAGEEPAILQKLKDAVIAKFAEVQAEAPVWDTGGWGLPRKK